MPPSLPATLPLALLLAAPLAIAGVPLGARDLATVVATAAVLALAGERLCRLMGEDADGRAYPGWHLVAGVAAGALAVAALVHAAGTSARIGFLAFAVATIGVALATRLPTRRASGADWLDALRLTAIVVAVLAWARRQLAPLPAPGTDLVLPVWTDYVLHAVEIAQYANPAGLGSGAMLLAGEPPIFYHRAPYALPAVLEQSLGLVPLQAATLLLLPIGLCIAVVATALLADRIAGRRAAGWLAVAGVLALPDAAHYGLHNGFFGAHWLMFTAPGTGWAAAVCLLSAACAVRAIRERDRRALAAAVALAGVSLFFRAHLFLLWVPTLAGVLIVAELVHRGHARAAIGGAGAAVLAALAVVAAVPAARAAWLAFSAVDEYLPAVHATMPPTAYDGLYDRLGTVLPLPGLLLAGAVAVLPAVLGLWLPLLAALQALGASRARGADAARALPWIAALGVLGLTLVAPASGHGDFTEYQHRGLPLLYLLFVASSCAAIAALRPTGRAALAGRAAPGLAAAAIALSFGPLAAGDPAEPVNDGARAFFPLRLDGETTAVAAHIRAHRAPGQRLVALPGEPDATLNDTASVLVALSEAPAWLGRAGIQLTTAAEPRRTLIRERLADLDALAAAPDAARFAALAEARGIAWVTVRAPATLAWDREREAAAFRTARIAVYRAGGAPR